MHGKWAQLWKHRNAWNMHLSDGKLLVCEPLILKTEARFIRKKARTMNMYELKITQTYVMHTVKLIYWFFLLGYNHNSGIFFFETMCSHKTENRKELWKLIS